ncbi:diaminopimelate epimerase [Heliomicrobium modesticaldum Ice1]|uniref:Diaminopimelate epimerase n=1 Tax=Heliobacterium modesticaldum (strain ATCC 51547 / Ice1) TaxID=498761 RepID=DAPF_HELMI|nr:diaminopimelate epimerase [Heliomicrobium modesticaldum]B0TGR9.1 RecName: Full=Diaminopimelate epimerase; Short=DAP epimerase; AltName: Full=PLP-independent amino acid racemase [Heliomicrobium modesticaldum Ice1]ABZ84680.1 diaminopimelate epimerase [Heliomicrobium modesticaldum Ice1]
MEFVKMHGLGNDFIVVNAMEPPLLDREDWEEIAVRICDRHYGIGGDGLILLFPSDKADIRWRILNSDGSEPEMCGNGIRCLARYVYERGIVAKRRIEVETLAGIIVPEIITDAAGAVTGVCVDMGEPRLQRHQIPMVGPEGPAVNQELVVGDAVVRVTALSMGNPHCLIYVNDIDEAPVTTLGPKVEVHPAFPAKTNVEFVQVVAPDEVQMRVWERGAGPTLACGTGACATVVGSVLNGYTDRKVTVHLAGGPLHIEWREENNRVYMTGPAVEVFRGELPL